MIKTVYVGVGDLLEFRDELYVLFMEDGFLKIKRVPDYHGDKEAPVVHPGWAKKGS